MTTEHSVLAPEPFANSAAWHHYFTTNAALRLPLPWEYSYQLSADEYAAVIPSIQEFQLGESSEGRQLYRAAQRYAAEAGDPDYVRAIAAFIREEQRHAQDLKRFLNSQRAPAINASWVDQIFRRLRRGTNLDLALSVLVSAELIANVYYAALAAATQSPALQALCAQILHDEAAHVQFHCERLACMRSRRTWMERRGAQLRHRALFAGACLVVWSRHAPVFQRAGRSFAVFWQQCWREFNAAARATQRPALK